jgi:hypothetical protein
MGHLSDTDRDTYKRLRKQGILSDVDAHRLDLTAGVILVACSDGDQLPDIFNNISHSFEGQRQSARIHTIALNGGALLLPENSPLVTPHREDEVLLEHIKVARELKNINTIALYTHAPCGAGTLAGLTLEQELDLLLAAKVRIKESLPGIKAVCFCHIDRGESKRTYFVSRNKWILQHMYPENPEMWLP